MSDQAEELLDDDTVDVDAQLAAATAKKQAKARAARKPAALPKEREVKTAASPPGIKIPKPMVNVNKPGLQVQDPSRIGNGYEDETLDDAEAGAQEAPAPRRKQANRPTKAKRKYSAEQQAILDSIRAESSARVDIDDFLATKDKDQFHVPSHLIPDGFAVEWKNTAVNGKPVDSTYTASVESAGWRAAPAELFKSRDGEAGLVPESWDQPFIERGGSMLYIRPVEISEAIKQAEYEAAISQVHDKMASITQTPQKHNPRYVKAFSREYEKRQPVMSDTKR